MKGRSTMSARRRQKLQAAWSPERRRDLSARMRAVPASVDGWRRRGLVGYAIRRLREAELVVTPSTVADVLRAIDRLDQVGVAGVEAELRRRGLV